VLITDQFNNRVIEVDRNKNIVWSFGSNNPSLCNPGPGAIIGTNGAERIGDGMTVIAGTGFLRALIRSCQAAASITV